MLAQGLGPHSDRQCHLNKLCCYHPRCQWFVGCCCCTCSTILIEPGWTATITAERNVRINSSQQQQQVQQQDQQQPQPHQPVQQVAAAVQPGRDITCDPIQLAIFSHR